MKTKHRLWQLTVLFIMTLLVVVQATEVSENDILAASRKWIADNAVFQAESPNAIPEKAVQLADADGKAMPLWRVDLQPTGYLVMSSNDTLPPVVAFDTKGSFETPAGHPLPSMLKRQGEIFQTELEKPKTRGNELAAENQARWNVLLKRTRAESVTPSTIVRQPMLTTEWNQDAPFNYFCPSGGTYSERGITGCVALALAQMLKYHEWPAAGNGTKTFTDDEGDIQGSIWADFSAPYDWGAMLDSYPGKEERDYGATELAAARLALEMTVLVEADYGIDGTSAYSHNLHTLMAQYLGYASSAQYGDSRSGYVGYVAQSTLYSRIRSDMTAGRPAFLSYNGHTFIADGLGTMGGQDYYHFNYGWGGYQSGWYLLTDGYEGTVVIAATTNLQPLPVAMFKPMSKEQTSSFTLSWDFPKRLTAEAFRLTKTTGTRASTVISSSISGTARSYTLTDQSGTATYTLEAKVNGSWQAVSGGTTVTVKSAPAPMLELSIGDELKSIAGMQVSTTISANNSLSSLTVTSSRPDILPASSISVTGSGASRTVRLTPVGGATGNVLLYITATDATGNTVCQTAPLAVMADEPLVWHTNKEDAFDAAAANGKLVLLVVGRDTCSNTNYFRNTVCETADVKATLLAGYELWYANVNASATGYSTYSSGLGNTFPWIAIIDPANPSKRLRGHGAFMSLPNARIFLDPSTPYFSLDDGEIYVNGTTKSLELSVLKGGMEIRYRLDGTAPTTSDTLYSSAISLTSTTTVSARAFLDGEPVSGTVTKTYTFMDQVAKPTLSTAEKDYFFGSVVVTANCATPGAVIRYTTNLYYPTASDPVFPAEGLEITEDTVLLIRAFKDGMVQSDWTVSELYEYELFPEAQDIVIEGDVTMLTAGTPWIMQTTTYHSESSAAQSGAIGNNASTVMAAKVNGQGTLSFYRKVSSEKNYDFLTFSIDGVVQESISGTVDWTQKTFSVTGEGDHYLTWTYSKDGSQASGSDCGWIDDVSWRRGRVLESIAISSGPASIATASTGIYTCTATWSDGTTSNVTSDASWSLSSTTYASVSTSGVITNKNTTTTDQTVTLNVSYTYDGVPKTDSKSNITLAKKVLTSIAISGPNSIATASTGTYTCTATWSYGSNTTVTPTWSLSSTTYSAVSTAGVVTNKNSTTTDQTVTLNASYSINGVTKTASKSNITLAKKILTSIAISGPANIATASTGTYTCTASWSYGSTTSETATWSLSSTTYASLYPTSGSSTTVTNKNTTTTDQTVTLNASLTVNETTKTVSKSGITLEKKVLTGIAISGPNSIENNATATYTCTASWTYGDTTPVTPTWTLSSTTYASVSTAGVVTNKNTTTTDQTVNLNASYTISGVTKTANPKSITLLGTGEVNTLNWYTAKADAMADATDGGKLVLLVAGRDTCVNTNYFRNTVCTTEDIKATLTADYVLWYANIDSSTEYSTYSNGLGNVLPFLAIINPADQSARLRGHGGPVTIAEACAFLDLDLPYFSLDDSVTYVTNSTQSLQLSVLRDGAEIRYRLDSTAPTTSDTLYSSAISLTKTTTVSARAFKDGVAISDTVTKTYTFLQQVATPVLRDTAQGYFFGNSVVTATCSTSGATIRYTTDGSNPTVSSPVFPTAGLTVTETTTIIAMAFKDGMKESIAATRQIVELEEMEDAQEIVTEGAMQLGSPETAWFLQTTTYNTAPSAMQSGTIGHSSSTRLVAKISGAGTISFNWSVSSESGYDKLSFSIDGVQQDVISGTIDWRQMIYSIAGNGEHYLTWTYSKDYSYVSGSDCGWVDDIAWAAGKYPVVVYNGTGSGAYASGSRVTVTAGTTPAGKRFCFWDASGLPLTESQMTSATMTFTMPEGKVNLAANFDDNYTPVSDFYYRIVGEEVTITGYIGNQTEVVIPATIEGRPVTVIGSEAFAENYSITSVVIPDDVVEIGYHAFVYCTNLMSVQLPDSLQTIGTQIFYNCRSLEAVDIPDGVSYIGYGAFAFCESLASVHFPASLLELDDSVFYDCKSLTSVRIPDSCTNLGYDDYYGDFQQCRALESVVIGDGVEWINPHAFSGCPYLKYVQTDNNYVREWFVENYPHVTIVGMDEETPSQPYELVTVDGIIYILKDGVAILADVQNKTLVSMEIPAEIQGCPVVAIGDSAFHNCERLSWLRIPDSVMSIGKRAFLVGSLDDVSVIQALIIGNGVEFIENDNRYSFGRMNFVQTDNEYVRDWLFLNAPNVTTLGMDEETPVMPYGKIIDGITYLVDGDAVVVIGNVDVEAEIVVIHGEVDDLPVVGIDDDPFYDCRNLQIVQTDSDYVREWFTEYYPNVIVVGMDEIVPPIISRQDGLNETTFAGTLWIVIESLGTVDGLDVRYTLDGSEPTASSTLYTTPFEITDTCTIKASYFNGAESCSAVGIKKFFKEVGLDGLSDKTGLVFETSDGTPWTVLDDGGDLIAQSGAIGHAQYTYLQTTVTGPGTISFSWKVSSEASYDEMTFSIDGVDQDFISGEVDWAQMSYRISGDGEHVLTWTYMKDGSVSDGNDCGWVTGIVWESDGQILKLTAGWNWVSFHILPESHKVGDVLGTAGFTANDIIQTNGVSARFTGNRWHLENFTVEFGKMYQIFVANAVTVVISGEACESFTVPLTSGWNWIGNPTSAAVSPSQLTHSGGWTANDRIQTSGGASATYTGNGWVPADFTLESGKGYQIHTAKAGTLTFPNESLYAVVDLSGGPDATSYPVRYTSMAPDLDDDTCRTTELWLRRIPAGTFIMGSPEDEVGRFEKETQHEVTLTQDYYIGVFECTQKQWELVMGTKPSYFNNVDFYATRPVEQVSYDMIRGTSATGGGGWPASGHAVDASSFMGKLQEKTDLVFDLPTEAQWEYACRAGTTTALNSGKNLVSTTSDDNMDEVGRYGGNGGSGYSQNCTTTNGTAKVGSYLPNNWGLYDMHGNVYEWCLDQWQSGDYGKEAVVDPLGPNTGGTGTGVGRMPRGSYWLMNASYCRSAFRLWGYNSSYDDYRFGFRIVLLP